MNNCEQLHETVIRDIVDVASDVRNSDEVSMVLNRTKSYRSIAQASSNLVLVFPVLTTNIINVESASMVAKAIERKAVSMLQMLFSAVNVSSADNALDYIKHFHTNMDMKGDMSIDGFMNAMDKFVFESGGLIDVDIDLYQSIKEDMKNINFTLEDMVSESSINDFKISYNPVYNTERITKKTYLNEAPSAIEKATIKKLEAETAAANARAQTSREQGAEVRARSSAASMDRLKSMKDDIGKKSYSYENDKSKYDAKYATEIIKNYNSGVEKQILNSDIKKANELIPTSMTVNFISTKEDEPIVIQNIVIGVKAKLCPIDSMDLINRIKLKNEDNNGLIKFIRATTREISFFKDFIFAIDKAKIDAISSSKKGSSSKMWKILERRAIKSKVRRTLSSPNDATAITTLVVSQEEAEYLKKMDNIDIEKPNVIRPIMESYNLMGVCIVDEASEVAKFIFDTGDDIYELLPFRSLEKEASDGSYKKMVNLMSKMK